MLSAYGTAPPTLKPSILRDRAGKTPKIGAVSVDSRSRKKLGEQDEEVEASGHPRNPCRDGDQPIRLRGALGVHRLQTLTGVLLYGDPRSCAERGRGW